MKRFLYLLKFTVNFVYKVKHSCFRVAVLETVYYYTPNLSDPLCVSKEGGWIATKKQRFFGKTPKSWRFEQEVGNRLDPPRGGG